MAPTYDLRHRIQSAKERPLLVGAVSIPSADVVEIVGNAGFDAVMIDAEHGALSPRDIQDMIRAADGAGIPAMVRVPVTSKDYILRALDAGASGIIVPHVNDAEEAQLAVTEAKYPPVGHRGAAFYARTYGFSLRSGTEVLRAANEEVVIGVQIETTRGVENAEEILRTPWVDFVLVGPNDLSVDRGTGLSEEDPWVAQAMKDLGALARSIGVTAATRALTDESARTRREEGYDMLVTGMPQMLAKRSVEYVRTTRDAMDLSALS